MPPAPPLGPRSPQRAWARKRIILPVIVGSWFIGCIMGAAGSSDSTTTAAAAKPAVTATVTATATAEATVTATPKPAATVTVRTTKTVRATVTAKAAGSGSGGDDSSSVYYANCSEVRAAGAAPIYRGDPGYSSSLDRDGDGVACE
jgi:hypothetical protein